MRKRPPKPARAPTRTKPKPVAFAGDVSLPARLLSATSEILAEKGIASVSLRAVARRAGVSHGAPGYHFRGKAGLLAAYAADGFRRLVEGVGVRMRKAGDDPRSQLAAIGTAYVEFALANPAQFGVMFRRDMHGTGDRALEEASSRAFGALANVMKRASSVGYLRGADIDVATAAAWSVAHGLAVLLLEERIPARISSRDPVGVSRRAIDFFVDRILGGPKQSKES